jgi:DNA-directed RNA polymerase specialized sigma24 family protein
MEPSEIIVSLQPLLFSITSPSAYLSATVTRLAIDVLRGPEQGAS